MLYYNISLIPHKTFIQEDFLSMTKNISKENTSRVFTKHNHDSCYKTSMEAIEKHCTKKNLQFTPLRRKVFEFLLRDHRPLGAYEILDLLREEGLSSKPPIAYRILDFLIEQGFVHKIKGLNAFVACAHPGSSHSPAFMICRKCEKVAELEENESGINLRRAPNVNFKIEKAFVEIIGLCKSCIGPETA